MIIIEEINSCITLIRGYTENVIYDVLHYSPPHVRFGMANCGENYVNTVGRCTAMLTYFIDTKHYEYKCQECLDAIDPLEILAAVEL